jgi:hypothetical protein
MNWDRIEVTGSNSKVMLRRNGANSRMMNGILSKATATSWSVKSRNFTARAGTKLIEKSQSSNRDCNAGQTLEPDLCRTRFLCLPKIRIQR